MLCGTKFKILAWSHLYIPMSWGKVWEEKGISSGLLQVNGKNEQYPHILMNIVIVL
jgi:hypothetical protein